MTNFTDNNFKLDENGRKVARRLESTVVFSEDLCCRHVKTRACLGKDKCISNALFKGKHGLIMDPLNQFYLKSDLTIRSLIILPHAGNLWIVRIFYLCQPDMSQITFGYTCIQCPFHRAS